MAKKFTGGFESQTLGVFYSCSSSFSIPNPQHVLVYCLIDLSRLNDKVAHRCRDSTVLLNNQYENDKMQFITSSGLNLNRATGAKAKTPSGSHIGEQKISFAELPQAHFCEWNSSEQVGKVALCPSVCVHALVLRVGGEH